MKQIAFITGAGGDIGRATALKLSIQGYHLVCVDISVNGNEKTRNVVTQQGGEATTIIADVTCPEAVEKAVQIACGLGHVSIIVNNAGRAYSTNHCRTTYEQWRKEQDLNLNSAFLVLKAFQQQLTEKGNCAIVNISSVNGLGAYGNTPYSVAKAGMIHYTRQLSTEFGKYSVRVNCVTPGTVRTQAWDERLAKNPAVWDEVTQWYALERVAFPQDVANAISFLCSEEASAITGVNLPVDCGLTAGVKKMADSFCQDDF